MSLFCGPSSLSDEAWSELREDISRKCVKEFGRGNIYLSDGKYISEYQASQAKSRLPNLKF